MSFTRLRAHACRPGHAGAVGLKPCGTLPRWNVVIGSDREDLVCHHDLAPWNLVRDGDRWVFIDWDGAGPGSRLWDLAGPAADYIEAHLEQWASALLD